MLHINKNIFTKKIAFNKIFIRKIRSLYSKTYGYSYTAPTL